VRELSPSLHGAAELSDGLQHDGAGLIAAPDHHGFS